MAKVKPLNSWNWRFNDLPGKKRCELKFSSFILVGILIASSAFAVAQTPTATLRGQVTDPSGAVVTNATVAIVVNGVPTHSAATNRSGIYEIGNLTPGKYTVTANAKGFATFAQTDVEVAAGQTAQLNIALEISVQKEKVNVEEQTPQIDVNPASNASALVLSGKDLESLSDDPDELQQDLEALAGPSAGPNGGQIYIDGFTGGQLPPKSSIREVRINQNAFSAEYDRLGYGRIEVFTKPGTDKFHGQVSAMGNSSAFNSPNPFLGGAEGQPPVEEQPYYSTMYMANVGGPLSKKASFFFDFHRRDINEVSIIDTPALGSNNEKTTFTASVPNPRTHMSLSPRLDYQVTPNNTLTARYQYFRETEENAGIGQFSLPSTGNNSNSTEHTFQVSDTQVLSTKAVNETRFRYEHESGNQTPLSTDPSINVMGAFTGGGSSQGTRQDHTDNYELQNYTSLVRGKHFVKFGGRLRAEHEVVLTSAGFNGSFTFPSLDVYQTAVEALAGGATTAPGASQFVINATASGTAPTVTATVADIGLYAQDDWRLRSNFTVSYGLRFETQNAIHDRADWAPRVALAWGIGGNGKNAAKTVLRAGFGMFYDRFSESNVLNSNRMDGVTQQQYVVAATSTNPIDFFPLIPPVNTLPPSQTAPTIYRIAPQLHSPYIMQSAFSLERQLSKIANLSVSYLNSRGVHQFVTWNSNAPLPGTPNSAGPRPDPSAGNIFLYDSKGVFRQNQLITNFNVRASKLTLFGFYMLNYANSDVSGSPSNPYNIAADYGRSSFDTRHRLFLGGSIAMRYGFRISPFMVFNSGSPYNVTVGDRDVNGDSVFSDRPAFATNAPGTCTSTVAKCYYTVPTTGTYTPIPINYLSGPAQFTLNLRLSKTFGFGREATAAGGPQGASPRGPGGGPGGGHGGPGGGGFGRGGGPGGLFGASTSTRRYNLTFSINARNVLNHVNPATPVGTLSSDYFGKSNALAGGPFSSGGANRKIELQAMFSF